MDLSIIIVNWNVRDLLEQCLRSIEQNVTGLETEVIVVDNASHDDSVAMVRERFPKIKLIANADNAGFCRGNNQGIAVSAGDFVCLLNPDTEVYEGAMERLVGFLREHPDAGIVGPDLLSPPGTPARINGTRFPAFWREFLACVGIYWPNRQVAEQRSYGRSDFDVTAEVDVVCGACLLARRTVIDQIGGLDEDLFMFFDEPDYCLRAHRAGWRTFYVPEAKILHVWMGSVVQDPKRSARRLYRARFVYFRKHYGLIAATVLRTVNLIADLWCGVRVRIYRVRDSVLRMARLGAAPPPSPSPKGRGGVQGGGDPE